MTLFTLFLWFIVLQVVSPISFETPKSHGKDLGYLYENPLELSLWNFYANFMNNSLHPEALRWTYQYRKYRADRMSEKFLYLANNARVWPITLHTLWAHMHKYPKLVNAEGVLNRTF